MTGVINGCSGRNSRAGQIREAACKQPCHPASELPCNALIFPRLGQLPSERCPSCQTARRSRQTLIRCEVEPTKPGPEGRPDRSEARLRHRSERSARSRRSCVTTGRSQGFAVPRRKSLAGRKASTCPAATRAARPSHRGKSERSPVLAGKPCLLQTCSKDWVCHLWWFLRSWSGLLGQGCFAGWALGSWCSITSRARGAAALGFFRYRCVVGAGGTAHLWRPLSIPESLGKRESRGRGNDPNGHLTFPVRRVCQREEPAWNRRCRCPGGMFEAEEPAFPSTGWRAFEKQKKVDCTCVFCTSFWLLHGKCAEMRALNKRCSPWLREGILPRLETPRWGWPGWKSHLSSAQRTPGSPHPSSLPSHPAWAGEGGTGSCPPLLTPRQRFPRLSLWELRDPRAISVEGWAGAGWALELPPPVGPAAGGQAGGCLGQSPPKEIAAGRAAGLRGADTAACRSPSALRGRAGDAAAMLLLFTTPTLLYSHPGSRQWPGWLERVWSPSKTFRLADKALRDVAVPSICLIFCCHTFFREQTRHSNARASFSSGELAAFLRL